MRIMANITTLQIQDSLSFKTTDDGTYPFPEITIPKRRSLEPLTVIIIPHSHTDPGWLQTLDEYYVSVTKNILDNMVTKLTQYPNMTFVWSEIVFMAIWWQDIEDATKIKVRNLVRNGQLEIVLGGWVMPDEASTHYYSVIDQLMEGHRWVYENLHVKPKHSWSVDPFGHSGTMPYLWKRAGMEKMVIQRIHQAVKGYLAERKSLEFYWRQPWDDKGSTDNFCHVMPYKLYNIKFTCGPNRFICLLFDFRNIQNEMSESRAQPITVDNIEERATQLYEQYRKKAGLYRFNTALVPLGDDFRYGIALEWDQQYENYQKLMKYMNGRKDWKIHVKFGTLNDYFRAVKKEQNVKYPMPPHNVPILSGDFFPYSDENYDYWTGYFTTRPFDKQFSAEVAANLRAADILYSMATAYLKQWRKENIDFTNKASVLQTAHWNLGLFQHHDAITGTSREHVVIDYENKLLSAYNATKEIIKYSMQALLTKGTYSMYKVLQPDLQRSHYAQFSYKTQVKLDKNEVVQVVLFNPSPQARREVVQLLVDTKRVILKDWNMSELPYQIMPVWQDDMKISETLYYITFLADLPPLALSVFTLTKAPLRNKLAYTSAISFYNKRRHVPLPRANVFTVENGDSNDIVLENSFIKATFGSTYGLLKSIMNKKTGHVTACDVNFLLYRSQGSGAYIFNPYMKENPQYFFALPPLIRVVRGPIVSEVQVVTEHFGHSVKIYHTPHVQGTALHFQNLVDISLANDVELIMRLNTNVTNNDRTFYTDGNGFQLVTRKTTHKKKSAGNYYPITSMVVIEDMSQRLTLHSGQAHGVASLETGSLEVMLDRRLEYDDGRGLAEGVQDNKQTLSAFILQVEYSKSDVEPARDPIYPSLSSLALNDMIQQPLVTYHSLERVTLQRSFKPIHTNAFPCDISLVSLRSLGTTDNNSNRTSMILHRRGYDCNYPVASNPTCFPGHGQVNVGEIFMDLNVTNVAETSLTHLHHKAALSPKSKLNIKPMEINSYLLTL